MCDAILEQDYHFILVCKPDSHKTLYQYLLNVPKEKKSITIKKGSKRHVYSYTFMNQVPIRDGDDALLVNWLEVTEVEQKTGKIIYKNSFVTDYDITQDNVDKLALAGRSRWRIENEVNNTLKTKGYRFEHNYGHGKNNLSTVFASMACLAFLYHTVMGLVDSLYIRVRALKGSRMNFFNLIRGITSIVLCDSWDSLMLLMLPSKTRPPIFASDLLASGQHLHVYGA